MRAKRLLSVLFLAALRPCGEAAAQGVLLYTPAATVSHFEASARAENGQVRVRWQTTVELGVEAFRVLRQRNGGAPEPVGPGYVVAQGEEGGAYELADERVKAGDGPALTAMEWPVTPDAMYWGPRFFYERYGLPIAITENGMGGCDWVSTDGAVHDPQRIDFTRKYLLAYRRAIEDGTKALAYFHWSIMDNFEWAFGYKRRFGMVYVDFKSGKRIPKDSAYWYRDVIASNGAVL